MQLDYHYIVARIQHALVIDPRVSMLDVKVMVSGGKIHLVGQVDTPEQRDAISAVVREVVPDMELRNETTLRELAPPAHPEVIG